MKMVVYVDKPFISDPRTPSANFELTPASISSQFVILDFENG